MRKRCARNVQMARIDTKSSALVVTLMKKRLFSWWTGDVNNKSWGVCYGNFEWPSRCEWFVPGTW
jgi:hypothetical protein